jgi:hypothetical protein
MRYLYYENPLTPSFGGRGSKSQPPVVRERKECPLGCNNQKGSSARAVMKDAYHAGRILVPVELFEI